MTPVYLFNSYSEISFWPVLSAVVFVAIALVLSLFLIFEHLAIYNEPEEQKFLIGLVLMIPVYAVESLLSLLNYKVAFLCEIMRDCYEAFAMYCFERYLIACLGGEDNTIMLMEAQAETAFLDGAYEDGIINHPFPLNFCARKWLLGANFYHAVKIGIVQYMILKTVCAMLAIVLQLFDAYGEGKFEWKYGYPYLAVVLNFSQTWALYCLVQFYAVTKDRLESIKPLPKFLAFKSIVFLTWWQGVIVSFFFSFGFVKSALAQELQTRIQDYFICIEMGIAAIVHLFVFPATPYKRGERGYHNIAVLSDYAALDVPPDPEEVRESERPARASFDYEDRRKKLNFRQSVRDVVVGSGETMVDDVKYTVSHVMEPVERGFTKINKTIHNISENVKKLDQLKKKRSKDDDYLIPLKSQDREYPEIYDLPEGSSSDSSLLRGRQYRTRRTHVARVPSSHRSSFEFSGDRWS